MPNTKRYSRFVRVMRLALPVGAVAILGLLVIWPRLHGLDDAMIVPSTESVELERDGRVRLDSPRYVGEAGGAGAYSVEAEAARVDPASPRKIELERMRADIPTATDGDIAVEAGRAVYDRDRAMLDLAGGIEVMTDAGFKLTTQAAEVALEAGKLRSLTPVKGEGPDGELEADRLAVEDEGAILRFTGNVRVRLPGAEHRAARDGERGS